MIGNRINIQQRRINCVYLFERLGTSNTDVKTGGSVRSSLHFLETDVGFIYCMKYAETVLSTSTPIQNLDLSVIFDSA
jgi:hypothetical protein